MVALQRLHFGIETRNVLRSIIVGEKLETEVFKHFRARLRAALFGIERNDAPSNEIGPRKKTGFGWDRRIRSNRNDGRQQISRDSRPQCLKSAHQSTAVAQSSLMRRL